MKIDPWYIFLLKAFGMVTLAVMLGFLVFYMWVAVGIITEPSYPIEHEYSGTIIGMNETRLVFYVETETALHTIPVHPDDFNRYKIGDQYEWIIVTYHRRTGITNLTMIHSW